MNPDASGNNRRELEWELLRALCFEALDGNLKRDLLALLAQYDFSDPIRQAVFDEGNTIGWDRAGVLREALPARLTRRGFPDVDFEGLFAPPPPSAEQALEWARELVLRAGRA